MLRKSVMLAVPALVMACSGDPTQSLVTCQTFLPPNVVLQVGQYVSLDQSQSCAVFPANPSATDTAEYLVVEQSVGGAVGSSAPFELEANAPPATAVSPPAAPTLASAPRFARPGGALAAQFDRYLRQLERQPALPPATPAQVTRSASVNCIPAKAPVHVGDIRTFCHVCAQIGCNLWDTVSAVAKSVSGHIAIFVDPNKPGDLSQADLDSMAQTFDQHGYVVDTLAFGREPDTDGNGVVIALLSGIINHMSNPSTCFTTGYIVGFFFSPDLDIQVANNYDPGEIMYGLVADTLGVYDCPHTIKATKRLLPATFVHEFQHMINYTQHVRVRRANGEDTWLNEALSKYAEELAGRSFLPGDSASFRNYTLDDLNNAYMYLQGPENFYLLSPDDGALAEYGSGWLFMRFLVDQSGDSITRKLVNTSLTGISNVSTQSGVPFETLVQEWALANWVSDLPGFPADPHLRYTSWQFRQAFADLQARDTTGRYPVPFPLAPYDMIGSKVNLAGILHGGSPEYVHVKQPPSTASFTLVFSGPLRSVLPSSIKPRLVVLRLH